MKTRPGGSALLALRADVELLRGIACCGADSAVCEATGRPGYEPNNTDLSAWTRMDRGTNDNLTSGRDAVWLSPPHDTDYIALHRDRFAPVLSRLVDGVPISPSLTEFLNGRHNRLRDPACHERIIYVGSQPVGTVTAFGIDTRTRTCSLGIVIVRAAARGYGVGPRALRAFFAELVHLGVTTVELETFVDNVPARAAFEKVGFVVSAQHVDHDTGREVVRMVRHLSVADLGVRSM